MPPAVLAVLIGRIEDPSEPQAAETTIFHISQNKAIDRPQPANILVRQALDTDSPIGVRAAIHGIGFLNVSSARNKLIGLNHDLNDKIAGAAIDIGVSDMAAR